MRFGSLTTCVSLVCAALLIASGARADELGRNKMGHYLIQAKFTDVAWASMAAKPQDRKELLAKVVGRLGGQIKDYWLSFGEYDAFVVVELPSDVKAEALQIAGMAGAGFKTLKTTSLLSVEEGMEAMKDAGDLRASGQYKAAHDALTGAIRK